MPRVEEVSGVDALDIVIDPHRIMSDSACSSQGGCGYLLGCADVPDACAERDLLWLAFR